MNVKLRMQFEEKLGREQWEEFKEYAREIEERFFDHHFDDPNKLYHALVVRGSKIDPFEFERLEFLGDSILKAIIGEILYRRTADNLNPGQLTTYRSSIEKNKNLARTMDHFEPNRLAPILGIGGVLTEAQKAQLFEALIGAYFLETSYEKTKALVLRHFNIDTIIEDLSRKPWGGKHPKSYLDEVLKKNPDFGRKYVCDNKGSQNAPQYECRLEIYENEKLVDSITSGRFPTKKEAETDAAEKLLEKWRSEGKL